MAKEDASDTVSESCLDFFLRFFFFLLDLSVEEGRLDGGVSCTGGRVAVMTTSGECAAAVWSPALVNSMVSSSSSSRMGLSYIC